MEELTQKEGLNAAEEEEGHSVEVTVPGRFVRILDVFDEDSGGCKLH